LGSGQHMEELRAVKDLSATEPQKPIHYLQRP